MKNTYINEAYLSHPFYYNRTKTDSLFMLSHGAVNYKNKLDRVIRFVEKSALLDGEIWAKFIAQFNPSDRGADDHDWGWRGEYWGKMMRGACFVYSYTRSAELYEVLQEAVCGIMKMQDEYGRISSYSKGAEYHGWDIWSRKYVLLGMQYFMEICPDEGFKDEITKCMCGQLDYMIETLGDGEGKTPITKTSNYWLGMNSCSVLEPVVRLYNLTGKPEYLNFATYIVNTDCLDAEKGIFTLALEDELYPYEYPVSKAYEMMSCFEGLVEYYRTTGEKKCRAAAENFARRVINSEISIIGSSGCTHELFDHTEMSQTNTKYNGIMQETCVTVTWMKFCLQMLCLTGDSIYADQIEKSMYNAYIGAINFHEDDRLRLPFDSYSPLLLHTRMRAIGGLKAFADYTYYGCCACIGAAGAGIISMSGALAIESGICLNLYGEGKVDFKTPSGKPASIEIHTDYPKHGRVEIIVNADEELEIKLRIPAWSKQTEVSVCGEKKSAEGGKYLSVKRKWSVGDKIELAFDMSVHAIYPIPDPTDENSKYHVAMRRGPVTLARDIRLPGDILEPVDFSSYGDGKIPCRQVECDAFEADICLALTQSDGSEIYVVDYASAGDTYDENSILTAWMPTRNYWQVDLSKPIKIVCPETGSRQGVEYDWIAGEDGVLTVSADKCCVFAIEDAGDGYVYIKCDKGYLSAEEKDDCPIENIPREYYWNLKQKSFEGVVRISDKQSATRFDIHVFSQNKCRIYTAKGYALRGSNQVGTPIATSCKSALPPYEFMLYNI